MLGYLFSSVYTFFFSLISLQENGEEETDYQVDNGSWIIIVAVAVVTIIIIIIIIILLKKKKKAKVLPDEEMEVIF